MRLDAQGVLPVYIYKDILAAFQNDEFLMDLMKWAFKNCDAFPPLEDGKEGILIRVVYVLFGPLF